MYSKFYEQVVQQSQGLTDEPVLPRKRKSPKRVNDGANPHQHLCPKDWYRQKYFEALDEVTNKLSRGRTYKQLWKWRNYPFQSVLGVRKLLCFMNSGEHLPNDFQMEHLRAQLKMHAFTFVSATQKAD